MRRNSFLAVAGLLLAVGGVLAVALVALLRHEPHFYARSAAEPGPARKRLSNEFTGRFVRLVEGAVVNREPQWDGSFTADQLNSYFEEDFQKLGAADQLPGGFHSPRVEIDDGVIRVGARYRRGLWSSVVSLELRVWLVAKEANAVAVEVRNFRAGGLPLGGQALLARMSEAVRQMNLGVEINWYRHRGNPVALLRFQTDRSRPSVLVQRLALSPGKLEVAGKSVEPNARVSPAR